MASKPADRLKDRKQGVGRVSIGILDQYVGFRMRRVQNRLSRDFAMATAAQGLRSGIFSSLAIIEANPGISQIELSELVSLDKSVTVSIVDDMESAGWAVRERSKEDRRRHALYITDEGKAHLAELMGIMNQTESAVLHALSPAEMALLGELLDRMYLACLEQPDV